MFLSCSWLDPLLWLGFRRKKLQQEDLFDTPNYVISASLEEKFERWGVHDRGASPPNLPDLLTSYVQ